MSRVQQTRIDHHETRFEDPEEPLVPHHWGDGGEYQVWVGEVERGGAEVLGCAVDGPDSDESGGDVERRECGTQI